MRMSVHVCNLYEYPIARKHTYGGEIEKKEKEKHDKHGNALLKTILVRVSNETSSQNYFNDTVEYK